MMWGLAALRQKRLIENIPTSKIRSAAMGLVELNGAAKPVKEMAAPLSGRASCWWRVIVEEYRKSGKNSSWVTIKDVQSFDPFYIQDDTGQVLIVPAGASMRAPAYEEKLSSLNEAKLKPLLQSWGVETTAFFGLANKTIRVREHAIVPLCPLYVLGELTRLQSAEAPLEEKFRSHVRALKSDPSRMRQADADQNGVVDPQEWDRFLAKEKETFAAAQALKKIAAPSVENIVLRATTENPLEVAVGTQEQVVSRYRWRAALGVPGGLASSGLGAYLLLGVEQAPLWAGGLVGVGLLLGYLISRRLVNVNIFVRGL